MAVANVKVTCDVCGKEYTVRHVCRNRKGVEEFKEWLMGQNHSCPECYKKALREKQRVQEANIRSEFNISLPVPEGSEKQIAWAESIRTKFIKELDEYGVVLEEIEKRMPLFWKEVIQNSSSRFWIDNRMVKPLEKFNEYYNKEIE